MEKTYYKNIQDQYNDFVLYAENTYIRTGEHPEHETEDFWHYRHPVQEWNDG